MRKFLLQTVAATLLAAGPALAADGNYNARAASTAESTTANCHSALMRDACASLYSTSYTEAPLPAAGAGLLGVLLMGGAGAIVVVARRRRNARPS